MRDGLTFGAVLAELPLAALLTALLGAAALAGLLWLLTRDADSLEVEAPGFRLRWKRRKPPR